MVIVVSGTWLSVRRDGGGGGGLFRDGERKVMAGNSKGVTLRGGDCGMKEEVIEERCKREDK